MSLLKRTYHAIKRHEETRRIDNLKRCSTGLLRKQLATADLLFITNNHTGGTKNYEQILLEGKPAVILRRVGYSEDADKYYEVEDNKKSIEIITKEDRTIVFSHSFSEIIVSTLIDFDDWSSILDELVLYKHNHSKCSLRYLIHDFHCICPKCNLFINGKYYPPEDSFFPQEYEIKGNKVSLPDWQNKWRRFLMACDEIRCFSQSSKELILSAYPMLDKDNVTVVPHDMSYCHNTPIIGIEKLPLHIGVVGACFGDFKGKPVVSEMIKRYGNEVPITLIGSHWWRFMLFRLKTKYLGPYNRDELQSIITKEKISCVLFPSLCPETFSYLVSELIMMNIPVLCFNYGAQAEKIKKYEKGILLENTKQLWKYIEENK